jgi:hypothetical protein
MRALIVVDGYVVDPSEFLHPRAARTCTYTVNFDDSMREFRF